MKPETIRQQLHQYPEQSGEEQETARRLMEHLQPTQPDTIISNLGGHGVAACYKGPLPGPRVLLRCDMDALPIREPDHLPHCSKNSGISHKCGHDGHMAIMLGVAQICRKWSPKRGEVVLLFQPSEETGEGAFRVKEDPRFKDLKPDWVFGMHNLPGFPLGHMVVRNGCFALASRGLIIELTGHTSHAAEPEKGNSPVRAVAQLLNSFTDLPSNCGSQFGDFVKSTVIHTNLGEIAFGTTPGQATVMVTLRTHGNDEMDRLASYSEELVRTCSQSHNLSVNISWTEEFPSCQNHPEAVKLLRRVAGKKHLPSVELMAPFGWSEDFGHFLDGTPGAIFGMGSGQDCFPLHHPNYQFPDALIPHAVTMWHGLLQEILN